MNESIEIRVVSNNGFATSYTKNLGTLDCRMVENDVGALTLQYPDAREPSKDDRIYIYYRPYGGFTQLLGRGCWFVRKRKVIYSRTGVRAEISALHCNVLLRRRIVIADAGTADADKDGFADDLIKQYCQDAFGTSAITARKMPFITIEPNSSDGIYVEKAASHECIIDVAKSLANTSAQQGIYLGFAVEAVSETAFVLRTSSLCMGANKLDRLKLTLSNGSLSEVSIEDDWSNEDTVAYVGGDGQGTDMAVEVVEDPELSLESLYGVSEVFVSAQEAGSNSTRLQAAGYSHLRSVKNLMRVEGTIVNSPDFAFGLDYDWGDLAMAGEGSRIAQCRLDQATVTVSNNDVKVDVRVKSL